MTSRREPPDLLRRAVTTPLTAGALLFVLYLALSALTDPSGYLGTDTGTKVLTLEVMERDDTFSPDIGYWAEDLDPSGSLHPVHQTERRPDGSWVGVTTLPMLEAGEVLYRIGGYRAALLLPMLGGVAAAFGARRIHRRLDPGSDGWPAFWVVGAASPVLVYSLDFWEHSLGVACILWAAAHLLGVLDGRPPWTAVFAGVLLGAGAVLRQEVLIYTLVGMVGTCAVLVLRRRAVLDAAVAGAAAVVGFAVPWFANAALEEALQGQSRVARSSGTAAAAVATGSAASTVSDRVREGLLTSVGLVAGEAVFSALLGIVVVAAVVVASRAAARQDVGFAKVALVAAGAIYLADAAGGLGYVPGMLTAFPLAIGGLLAWRNERARPLVVVALAALPLVYAFQYLGGAPPQWGGRYTLPSGSLLGVAALVGLRDRTLVLRGLVALSVGVSLLGAAWLVERSHGSADFFDEVIDEAEPVVIARQAFLLRESGPTVVGRRWLSVENEAEFTRAVDLARQSGADRFTVLEWDGPAPPAEALPPDVEEVRRRALTFVNTPVGLVTYEFSD